MKPRVDNVANLISGDPSSVHFNTLLASQLIINKNKDTLWNQYNSNKSYETLYIGVGQIAA